MNCCISILKAFPYREFPCSFKTALSRRAARRGYKPILLIEITLGKNFLSIDPRELFPWRKVFASRLLARARTIPLRFAYKDTLSGNVRKLSANEYVLNHVYVYLQLNSSREYLSVITQSREVSYLSWQRDIAPPSRGNGTSGPTHRHLLLSQRVTVSTTGDH